MRVGQLAAVLVCIAAAVCVLPRIIANRALSLRESKRHVYTLEQSVSFMSESDALFIARKTLEAEGYDVLAWRPSGGSPTKSPDGKKDELFFRGLDPGSGFIPFEMESNGRLALRIVDIEISGDSVTAYVRRPK
ncbi:MAG TPA: hypothetical protein PKC18_13740 [Lacipirellulaceae bacterium]|nr:hypothetical protein [Lacipirellulaceae bacterium]